MPDSAPVPTSPEPADAIDAIDAGELGPWLGEVQAAIVGDGDSDVPCGTCTACCTASQFVHIAPDEVDTLAHIPRALAFPAPGLPAGHVLLGYDEHGRCPMLVDDTCSIYAHRPRTCRAYDCRVFSAAGVEPEATKVEIRRRVARWRFRVASPEDRSKLAAIRAAAAFLRDHGADLEARSVPVPDNPTRRAVLAIELHETFLGAEREGPGPDPDAVAAGLRRIRVAHPRL